MKFVIIKDGRTYMLSIDEFLKKFLADPFGLATATIDIIPDKACPGKD